MNRIVIYLSQVQSYYFDLQGQTIWPSLPCLLQPITLTFEYVRHVPTSGSLHLLFHLLECSFRRHPSTWLTQMSFKSLLICHILLKAFPYHSLKNSNTQSSSPFLGFPSFFPALFSLSNYHLLIYTVTSLFYLYPPTKI